MVSVGECGAVVFWWSSYTDLHPQGSTGEWRWLFGPQLFRELCQERVERAPEDVQHSQPGLWLTATLRHHPGVLPASSQTHFHDRHQNGPEGHAGHLHHPGHHAALLPAQSRGLPAAPPSATGGHPELLRPRFHLPRQTGHHGTRYAQHMPGSHALLHDHQPLQVGAPKKDMALGYSE